MLSELVRPFSYLTIKHPSGLPNQINWTLPLAASIGSILFAYLLGLNVDVFSTNGIVTRFLGFIQNLPGFYVAALAAIATFDNKDMLQLMPSPPPTMKIKYNNGYEYVQLTRRRFLSAMFAYLTASSILITLASIAALAFAEPLKIATPPFVHSSFKAIFSFLYICLVAQMVCITMWGLFYLGERIHTPDR